MSVVLFKLKLSSATVRNLRRRLQLAKQSSDTTQKQTKLKPNNSPEVVYGDSEGRVVDLKASESTLISNKDGVPALKGVAN